MALLVAFIAYPVLRVWRFERHQAQAFAALELGASRDIVAHLAGQPTYTTDGTRWVEPDHARSESELIPGCVEEFWYYHGITLFPSKWSYCFAENGALVHKYHWVLW
jgi:hypothetical protein